MRFLRSLISNLQRSATNHAKAGAKVNVNGAVPARRFAQVHDVRIEYEHAPARNEEMASLNGV